MNMKVEPTISAQKNPGLPLRAAAVRLLGGVGGWGVGALRELAATTNKSLPRQQPRGRTESPRHLSHRAGPVV